MHGRLKVKTSDEVKAQQKKIQQEKADFYKISLSKIFEKRSNEDYDEELLDLTAGIININPDALTVWNIRKQVLIKISSKRSEELEWIVKNELKLTEVGLRKNPKSYSCWFQRRWVLDSIAKSPDWSSELQICTKYLELDDRNFHCWDYRRYVVDRSKSSLDTELIYTMTKLISNFSNYSAWHYRSKLIPQVHSNFDRESLSHNKVYQHEVSLVENAVYTDPNDQSAWFYYQWLLLPFTVPARIIQMGFNSDLNEVWVSIDRLKSTMHVEGLGVKSWSYLNNDRMSNVLTAAIERDKLLPEDKLVKLVDSSGAILDTVEFVADQTIAKKPIFNPVLTVEEKEYLEKQLKSYMKLLGLTRNKNRWILSTITMLREILSIEVNYDDLQTLINEDPMRKNYYRSLIGRYKLESRLLNVENWNNKFDGNNLAFHLLYHECYLTHFEHIDLSQNEISDSDIPKLQVLLSCKVLNLSDCHIKSLADFPPLRRLESLIVKRNRITEDGIPWKLLKCSCLKLLNLSENEISDELVTSLREQYPKITFIV